MSEHQNGGKSWIRVLAVLAIVVLGYVAIHQLASSGDRDAVNSAYIRKLADFHRAFFESAPPELFEDYNKRLELFREQTDNELISLFAEQISKSKNDTQDVR